jgi:hypothetical protein
VPAVSLYPGAASQVTTGGKAVAAAFGPLLGGFVMNPLAAADQDVPAEPLFLDLTGPAATSETATTIELAPGALFSFPADFGGTVWVNAATSGHKFSIVVYQPAPVYVLTPNNEGFPPSGPTVLANTIPSYLYVQYNDDDDLRAFVDAYNTMTQAYVTWFATTNLGDYTSLSGGLLDWVAQGLYGFTRPLLGAGRNRNLGPLNTYLFNQLAMNATKRIGPQNVTAVTDDVFQRVMTWTFYKGDGFVVNIRWLKRRIMRFLTAANGTAPNIDNTYPVSVTIGGNTITISISQGRRKLTKGTLNSYTFNSFAMNSGNTVFMPSPFGSFTLDTVFEEAIFAGVLPLPFQFVPAVNLPIQ